MPKINQETGKVYLGAACHGATLPATCSPGDTFIKTDNTAGQQLYACTATNTWTLQGGGGVGGAVDSVFGRAGDIVAVNGDYSWTQIASKPVTFPPEAHGHAASDIVSGTIATARLGGGTANSSTFLRGDQTYAAPPGGGGVPAGAIVLIVSGSCATTLGAGWTEETSLNGKFVLGTVETSADIGGTGGQDSVTSVLNHTHAVNVTDPGHTHLTQRYPTATGGSSGFTIDTSMSGTPANNTLPTASATTGITASTVNPAGGVASIDNRPAFVKVIFCRKT